MKAGHGLLLAAIGIASPARAQCSDGAPPPCAGRTSRDAASAPTALAVLYFENLSRDTADLYLADGLTEELTSRLGAVARLRVTGRSVVRRAQQISGGDVLAVGRALNVRYLVEGSVRRAGLRVRISARLLRASDGVRVWGDDYDRTMDDLLTMQVDIAREVAGNVAGQLLPAEQRVLAQRPTTNAAAYDHFLRARYLGARRTEAAITQAVAELDEALRLDPAFAAAEARKAQVLVVAYGYGVNIAAPESLAARAQRSAARALALDPGASETWLAIGIMRWWFAPLDLDQARSAFERSVALDPRNAEAVHSLGVMLMGVPDLPAATAAFMRTLAIEPARGVTMLDLAEIEYTERRFPAALRWVDSAIAVEPRQARNYAMRSLLRLRAGDRAGARADAEASLRFSTGTVRATALAALVAVAAAEGDSAVARRHLADIDMGPLATTQRVLALLYLGRTDEALDVLERGPLLPIQRNWLGWPEFDALRWSPRFVPAIARWAPPGARNP